jgi:hypothetical protein
LFGESAVLKDLSAVQIESVIGSISFYAFWAVLTFLLTLSEAARDARAWSFAGGVLFFILEINLIFGGLQLPSTFFPFMTVYEFTQLLRAAFPPFVNGTRAIGGFYYRSFAQENFALGIELLNSNRVTCAALCCRGCSKDKVANLVFLFFGACINQGHSSLDASASGRSGIDSSSPKPSQHGGQV